MAAAPAREDGRLTVALVSEVFWEPDGLAACASASTECADRGADIAVLPEIPLNPWRPATKDARRRRRRADGRARDARRRHEAAARRGSAWWAGSSTATRRPDAGRSRVLVFDRSGELVATYEKLHLPEEPGFWETSPLRPGHGGATQDRCIRPADRRPGLLRHEPPAGHAAARGPGRSGRAHPALQRGEDLPALEVRLPRQRADELPATCSRSTGRRRSRAC